MDLLSEGAAIVVLVALIAGTLTGPIGLLYALLARNPVRPAPFILGFIAIMLSLPLIGLYVNFNSYLSFCGLLADPVAMLITVPLLCGVGAYVTAIIRGRQRTSSSMPTDRNSDGSKEQSL